MENKQDNCPECGAPQVEGLDCWGQLGAILAWEWNDPELSAQHFLTVASYNWQHPSQFTDEAYTGLRTAFREHLDHGLPVTEIRRRISTAAAGSQRVLKPEAERHPVPHRWPLTIADVYIPHQPEGAASRVKKWAASIRAALAEEKNTYHES